jgi:FMN-dependent NADH-azoreductase
MFTFDGKRFGPALDIEKAFVASVRGQSDEARFETVPQSGFQYLSGYVEFWLRFIRVREVVTLALEHTWEGRRTGKAILTRKICADARLRYLF